MRFTVFALAAEFASSVFAQDAPQRRAVSILFPVPDRASPFLVACYAGEVVEADKSANNVPTFLVEVPS